MKYVYFRPEVPSRKQWVNINCCKEVIKTLYSAGYTQQLIVTKIILALLKYSSDKQFSMQGLFLRGKFQGSTSFVDLLCFVLSCVCYVFVRVCLYVLCGHLLGKG